jgi:hypothetical protein
LLFIPWAFFSKLIHYFNQIIETVVRSIHLL